MNPAKARETLLRKFSPKPCKVCGTEYQPLSSAHKYCSETCKGKFKYMDGRVTTRSQYDTISGNWRNYLIRLTYRPSRKAVGLTVDDLLELLAKQAGKCALSGVELTCTLERGNKRPTNASIDQIIPSAGYHKENIRLVAMQANRMKWALSDEELKLWCRRIVDNG